MPLVRLHAGGRSAMFLHDKSRDVNSYTKANTSIEPTNVFKGHTSVVGASYLCFLIFVKRD